MSVKPPAARPVSARQTINSLNAPGSTRPPFGARSEAAPMSTLPDHVIINRESWTAANAAYTHGQARMAWAQAEITWGVWGVPEAGLGAIPEVDGKDVIELG